ncbi:MAG TPA: glycosyltransferase 87 family protein [Micromonosporaceae bacterium]
MTETTIASRQAPDSPQRPGWIASGLLILITLLLAALPLLIDDAEFFLGLDFQPYQAAGNAVLTGQSPYDIILPGNMVFLYTPFAAVLMVPISMLDFIVALALWTLLSMVALQVTAWIGFQSTGVDSPRQRTRRTLAVTAGALLLAPIFLSLQLGQINIILMALVLADLCGRSTRWRGVGVGLAAAIKLVPLIFVAYLLVTRQFRAAKVAIVTFLGSVALGFIVLPEASAVYWGGKFIDFSPARFLPTGVSAAWNYSIRGLLVVDTGSQTAAFWLWLLIGGAVGVLGLLVARQAYLGGETFAAVLACGITGLLISPVSWSMHWVWCVPLLILAAYGFGRGGRLARTSRVLAVWLIFFAGILFGMIDVVLAERMLSVLAHVDIALGLVALGYIARQTRTASRSAGTVVPA